METERIAAGSVIMASKSIVISTGAGISAESGIKTFRDQNGLWENHKIEEVATPQGFYNNPVLVHQFYNLRRSHLNKVQPNAAHFALAELEKKWEGDCFLVTQNVDDLHRRAGSEKMVSIHGELKKARCVLCKTSFSWVDDMSTDSKCPHCLQLKCVRPDIVWFGELPYFMDEVYERISKCDLFVAIGTSGNVYPAASFSEHATAAQRIEVNLSPSIVASSFDEVIVGPATEKIPQLVASILNGQFKI